MRLSPLLLLGFLPLFAASPTSLDLSGDFFAAGRATRSWLDDFYGEWRMDHLLDNAFDDSVVLIETAGRIGTPDPLSFSVLGASRRWNHVELDGMRLDDPFHPGASLTRAPLWQRTMELDRLGRTVLLREAFPRQRLAFEFSEGFLGGRFAAADWLYQNLARSPSPYERGVLPPEDRRRPLGSFSLLLCETLSNGSGPLSLTTFAEGGLRHLLRFGSAGYLGAFDESWSQGEIRLTADREDGGAQERRSLLLTARARECAGVEYHLAPEESRMETAASLSGWITRSNGAFGALLGASLAIENTRSRLPDFTRNLIDQDGEGFNPTQPSGLGIAAGLQGRLERRLDVPWFDRLAFSADSHNQFIHFTPELSVETNGLTLDDGARATPIEALLFDRKPVSALLFSQSLGFDAAKRLGAFHLHGDLRIWFDGAVGALAPLLNPGLDWTAGVAWRPAKAFSFSILLAHRRAPLEWESVRAQMPGWNSGSARAWNDANGDGAVEGGELGPVTRRTGAAWWTNTNALGSPQVLSLDIPVEVRLPKGWGVSLTAQYRQFRNLPWLSYEGGPGKVGSTVLVGDTPVFVATNPETRFVLGPMPASAMTNGGSTFADPFYAGATVRIAHEGARSFFSASFTALMAPGISALGNGPLANDVGTIDESTANPNTLLHQPGRLAPDRGYIGRLLVGGKLTPNLRLAFQLKYKDGEPFHYFSAAAITNAAVRQAAIWNNLVAGDNPWTGEFGSRECAFWNTELRLSWKIPLSRGALDLTFCVYNLLDFGAELAEKTFFPENRAARISLETQVPRGLWMRADWAL
ncbi:MAG: hypothetical protein J0L75_03675 [Spirochaetes bacterium]|nr:hypothetical protein [Spirochaetota bacterium]